MSHINHTDFVNFMRGEVFGIPEDLIDTLGRKIALWMLGYHHSDAPLGAFLLVGDPGTGKSLTASAMAQYLHRDSKKFIKLAGEEFSESHIVAKLVGSPPGYLGHRETVPMLSDVKLKANTSEHCNIGVILVDEIDKAHDSFVKIFLGVLNDGFITMGDNSKANFKNEILLFTANFGASGEHLPPMGFPGAQGEKVQIKTRQLKSLGGAFLDRIASLGGTFKYPPMTAENRARILRKTLEKEAVKFDKVHRAKVVITLCPSLENYCAHHNSSGRVTASRVTEVVERMILRNLNALDVLDSTPSVINTLYIEENYDVTIKAHRRSKFETAGATV